MTTLLSDAKKVVERALIDVLDHLGDARPEDGPAGAHAAPARLVEAMRYALLSPGKRLRPALVFGGARATGAKMRDVLAPACAVEMIHAYSLVHDDLPSMDDDDLRRGRPTVHRAFDEATALLAGDALLTEALALLADGPVLGRARKARARNRVQAVLELSRAIGAAGMVGGQQDDIEPAGEPIDVDRLRSIHRRKTGRLIQSSAVLGAIWTGAADEDVEALRRFGIHVGLAFQLVDDALDGDGLARALGKDEVRREAQLLTDHAIAELARFGAKSRPLASLARMIAERET